MLLFVFVLRVAVLVEKFRISVIFVSLWRKTYMLLIIASV